MIFDMISNSTRTWLFLLTMSVAMISIGMWIDERTGLLWGFTIAFSVNSLAYFYSEKRLSDIFPSRLVEGQDSWGVLRMTRDLAQRSGIPIPEIHIVPSASVQSFVTGRAPYSARLYLTEGLLAALDPDELRSTLAVQMIHLKFNDNFAFGSLSLLIGFLLRSSHQIDRGIYWLIEWPKEIEKRQGGYLTALLAPLLSLIVRVCISRDQYLVADRLASELSGNPQALARALWKLESYASTRPFSVPAATAPMFIVNPLTNFGWFRYFHRQPTVETRIRELVGQYPI